MSLFDSFFPAQAQIQFPGIVANEAAKQASGTSVARVAGNGQLSACGTFFDDYTGGMYRLIKFQPRIVHHFQVFLVWLSFASFSTAAERPLADFSEHVRTESWEEMWPDDDGRMETRSVTAEIWTAAMQAALDSQDGLHIPSRALPYYIDAPLVLKSGQSLTADPAAEIRLKPGCNTCMIRNRNIAGSPNRPVSSDLEPDSKIHIEGGIWSTLATSPSETNGNTYGRSAKKNAVHGTHGVILLQNVRGVSVRNVTVRQSKPFAVHLGNVKDFTVDGLLLDRHQRDGVHVSGPASDGLIRNVRGDSRDDAVSLTAWDWANCAPSFGPIHDLIVENISGAPEGVPSANAIRLLPGVKRFSDDGTTLDCPISNITLRGITDITEFKLYDQPNLEMGRDNDFSIEVGRMKDIRFENLKFTRPGVIEIHANADGISVKDVVLDFPVSADFHLVSIGPQSMTYKGGNNDDPSKWTEIFSPDLDCTVRNLKISGVRENGSTTDLSIDRLVHLIEQKNNPDYPKTTPKGGTGKGIWIR